MGASDPPQPVARRIAPWRRSAPLRSTARDVCPGRAGPRDVTLLNTATMYRSIASPRDDPNRRVSGVFRSRGTSIEPDERLDASADLYRPCLRRGHEACPEVRVSEDRKGLNWYSYSYVELGGRLLLAPDKVEDEGNRTGSGAVTGHAIRGTQCAVGTLLPPPFRVARGRGAPVFAARSQASSWFELRA